MEKTQLGSDHPDYHTLLTAITQILEGLVLNAWRQECGQLHAFVATNHTPESILHKAREIAQKYMVPKHTFPPSNPKIPLKDLDMNENNPNASSSESEAESDTEPGSSGPTPDKTIPKSDTIYDNVVLLTQDLLITIELINAIQSGDFGHAEDMLPTLACMFHGAGSNNYSTEILHFLHNIKNVWTPEFVFVTLSYLQSILH